jgi:hypothetical protein
VVASGWNCCNSVGVDVVLGPIADDDNSVNLNDDAIVGNRFEGDGVSVEAKYAFELCTE